MKAYEFPAKVTQDGQLEIPQPIRKRLQAQQTVRIIVLVHEPDEVSEQGDWERLTAEQFLAGYSDAASIYDQH
jgi:bifunctional DNA-binding transcriptional regulator/antitoxin component of YhaV-PrlF toxin-antitoxin module